MTSNIIPLKYPGICSICGSELARKTRASWNRDTHIITCLSCAQQVTGAEQLVEPPQEEIAKPLEAGASRPESGTAGASRPESGTAGASANLIFEKLHRNGVWGEKLLDLAMGRQSPTRGPKGRPNSNVGKALEPSQRRVTITSCARPPSLS